MTDVTDMELLRRYEREGSEAAFAELVRRHVNLVFSVALRHVGIAAQAEEITQAVFVLLARKAARLRPNTILEGWLHAVTRLEALRFARGERRRQSREQEAFMQSTLQQPDDPIWKQLAPLLDEALSRLGKEDRDAVMLRYFKDRSVREIAAALSISEATAQRRVLRAVEKLRILFGKQGIVLSAAALTAAISAHSVQAAPALLAKSATALAIAKGATASGSTLTLIKGALKIMAWTNAKTAILGAVAIGAATLAVIQHQGQVKLRGQNQSLQQQVEGLQADNARLSTPAPRTNNPQTLPDDQWHELLRLRGEVGVLRAQTNKLGTLVARNFQPQSPNPAIQQQQAAALPDDYPKTPDGATKGIFDTFSRGDWDAFFTNYGEPGMTRDMYDQVFTDDLKSKLAGMKVLSIGEPTNSFGPNMWFVPYKVQFADGNEHEFRLHVAQNPTTQRWYFKGGF